MHEQQVQELYPGVRLAAWASLVTEDRPLDVVKEWFRKDYKESCEENGLPFYEENQLVFFTYTAQSGEKETCAFGWAPWAESWG